MQADRLCAAVLAVGLVACSTYSVEPEEAVRPPMDRAGPSSIEIGGRSFAGEFRVVIGPDAGCRFEFAGAGADGQTVSGQLALTADTCAAVRRSGMSIASGPSDSFDWIYENRGSVRIHDGSESPALHVRDFSVTTDAEGALSASVVAIAPDRIDFATRTIAAGPDIEALIHGRLTVSCLARDPTDETGTATILDPEGLMNEACVSALSGD